MILVSVGTFVRGFDALVAAADLAAQELGQDGFAQIGHSAIVPRHLAWERFVPEPVLRSRLRSACVVICHGGAGILGEAMRARRPIIAVPRRGATTTSHPANDQSAFVRRLAERYAIQVCYEPGDLLPMLRATLEAPLQPIDYRLGSDIPARVVRFLKGTAG